MILEAIEWGAANIKLSLVTNEEFCTVGLSAWTNDPETIARVSQREASQVDWLRIDFIMKTGDTEVFLCVGASLHSLMARFLKSSADAGGLIDFVALGERHLLQHVVTPGAHGEDIELIIL
jgi:hypothetical protein